MTRLESFRATVGDLARPFAIIVTGLSAAVAPLIIVLRIAPDRLDLVGAAALVGALYAGHVGLYGFRSWEKNTATKADAQVAIEQAKASTAPATTVTAPTDATVTVTPASEPDAMPQSVDNPDRP